MKHWITRCLKFWDEAGWFLSLRVFGLLSSSLLLFPKRCRNNNKDEDNSPKTINDKNWITPSEKIAPIDCHRRVFTVTAERIEGKKSSGYSVLSCGGSEITDKMRSTQLSQHTKRSVLWSNQPRETGRWKMDYGPTFFRILSFFFKKRKMLV